MVASCSISLVRVRVRVRVLVRVRVGVSPKPNPITRHCLTAEDLRAIDEGRAAEWAAAQPAAKVRRRLLLWF